MNVGEALNKAADLIERDGWYGGGGSSRAGAACASNAISWANGNAYSPAHLALIRYIGGVGLTDVFDWNDASERTAAEVVEVLRACAVVEEARESALVSVDA
jgi:hypothetical protein